MLARHRAVLGLPIDSGCNDHPHGEAEADQIGPMPCSQRKPVGRNPSDSNSEFRSWGIGPTVHCLIAKGLAHPGIAN